MSSHSGDHISAVIKGDVSGQVAVGSSIRQAQIQGTPPVVTEVELARVHALFAQLRAQVAELTSGDMRASAIERVDELHEAVVAEEPDAAALRHLTRWFVRKLPEVAGVVTGVFADPIVGKLVQAAGDGLVRELQS